MKYKKTAGLWAILLCVFLLWACAPAALQAVAPVTLTDMKGRSVTLQAPITRAVALAASDCEILYALGAQDALAGRGAYCDYPPEALALPAVQSNYEINLEQILALSPQVVFVEDMDPADEKIKAMEAAGIAVVMTNAHYRIEEVYQGIALIGAAMGKNGEAAAVIEDMRAAFARVSEKAAQKAGGKTVYFEVSPLEYGLWTAGSGTFMDEIAGMLGLTNAFSDVEGWSRISEEQVLERNPDYIVTIAMYYGEGPTPQDEIMGRAGWQNVAAVQNGAILNLQDDTLSRPGPRLAQGAAALYAFVYGNDAS